jgi:hypothetical protein
MKVAPGLADLLTGRQFAIADLYTITLRDGTILRYTSCDIDLVYSGQTYLANALKIRRGPITTSVGVEVDAVELTIECDGADSLFGQPIPAFVRNGGLDGARVLIQRAFLSDQTGPTALIVIDDTYIVRNGTTTVTFTFNDVVTGFTLDDVSADNGTLSGLTTADNITFTATFTAANPAGEFIDSSNSIVVDLAGVADLDGNYGVGTVASNNYTVDASYWLQRGNVLTASDAATDDRFGNAVALSADKTVLVVGAPSWEGALNNQGGVYTFDWSGSAWVQRGSVLTVPGAATSDAFGYDVALSADGTVLVVGVISRNSSTGAVCTFDWSGGTWAQRGSALIAADAATGDQFGRSVALSADGAVLVVGANFWEGALTDQGGVYTFDRSGSAWAQRGSVLTAPDAVATDGFGISAALSPDGDILVVGAARRDGAYTDQGGVYTFDRSGSTWNPRGSPLTAPDAAAVDLFGCGVALSAEGDVLVVGAYLWDGTYTDQGGVYIFDVSGSAWVQRGNVLTAPDAASGDGFGFSAALSPDGDVLVVGAFGWEGSITNQGGVYIYDSTL